MRITPWIMAEASPAEGIHTNIRPLNLTVISDWDQADPVGTRLLSSETAAAYHPPDGAVPLQGAKIHGAGRGCYRYICCISRIRVLSGAAA